MHRWLCTITFTHLRCLLQLNIHIRLCNRVAYSPKNKLDVCPLPVNITTCFQNLAVWKDSPRVLVTQLGAVAEARTEAVSTMNIIEFTA